MQIILLDKIDRLGSLGDLVKVKSGYARNFLIPKGKAIPANKKNIENFKIRHKELQDKIEKEKLLSTSKIEKINKFSPIKIFVKVGKEGKLFGSVNVKHIIEVINKCTDINLSKKEVKLYNKIRSIGKYKIGIHLTNDVFTKIDLIVVPEKE